MRIPYRLSVAAFVFLLPVAVFAQQVVLLGKESMSKDILGLSQLSGSTYNSQQHYSYLDRTISISLKGATLGQTLLEISRKASVRFSYDSQILPKSELLSIEIVSAPLQTALAEISHTTNLDWIPLSDGLIILTKSRERQQETGTISGSVSDARTGEPLIGANVLVEGTRLGAAADLSGKFRVEHVPVGTYNIVARYVGYSPSTRRVTVGSGATVTVEFKLNPTALGLSEVVVTGTGVATEKRQLGNAIATVSAKELQYSGASTIDKALSGKIPGALVEENSGAPDGGVTVRLRGTSTVLGSADPLYIVDGVIVNNASPVLIDLGGGAPNRLADLDPNMIDHIEVVKGAAAAALYGSLANNGVVQIFTKQGEPGPPKVTFTTSVNMSEVRKTLPVNMYPYNKRYDDSTKVPVQRYDWQNDIFRRAVGTTEHLDISGGSGGTRYIVSTSYLGNQGIIKGEDYRRGNVGIGLNQVLTDRVSFSLNAMYSNSNARELPNGGLTSAWGVLTGFLFGPNIFSPLPNPITGVYPHNGVLVNPVEAINLYDFQQQVSRLIGSVRLFANPIDGLDINYTLGYDTYTQLGTAFIPIGTSARGYSQGFSQRAELDFLHLDNSVNVSYKTALSSSLKSTTVFGGQLIYEKSSTFGGQSTQLSPIAQIVPAGATQSLSEYMSDWALYGVFGQETLGLFDRLFLTAAGRFDASSVFGAKDRVQFYPKLSADYLLSEEEFWKNSILSAYIPTLKLRAAFGESGGLTAIGPFDRFTLYQPVSYDGKAGLVPNTQLGAANIIPEREKELEVGTDMSFLANRVGLEFTYYQRSTTDLLLTRSLSPSTGYSSGLANVGTIDDWGAEILLRAIPVDSYIRWTSTVTFAADHNEIKNVPGGILLLSNGFGIAAAVNGQSFPVFYGSAFQRDANGNIVNVNGIPQRATQNKVIGNPNPKWLGSFINEFNIGRDWFVRVQLDAVVGQDVFNFTSRLGDYPAFGTLVGYQRELEGELLKGYNAAVFSIFENWVENGSFVKVREVSVSRTFYPEFLGIASLQASLIGRNLFCFTKYSGYDPETNVGGQRTGIRGFDFVSVPIPRSVSLELAFHF